MPKNTTQTNFLKVGWHLTVIKKDIQLKKKDDFKHLKNILAN